ncbi:MAG: PHP domain-containing protein [Pyrinomonadaceae bacterium]|nr:PHP domain-containing protein [Pyrinomonadaceae bacterium]
MEVNLPIKHRAVIPCVTFLLVFVFAGCGAGVSPFEKEIELKRVASGEPAYVYVPFEVPAGAETVSVVLNYDKNDGNNRIELGVFDERFAGNHQDKKGFRGWSGSVRDGFFIAKEHATRGYEKGDINPGKWHLIFGLAALESESVKAKISISFREVPADLKRTLDEETAKQFTHEISRVSGDKVWLRGDLHAHTFHGDGKWSVKAILDSARANKLDFVSITEHNTFSHHSEMDRLAGDYPELLILKGQEITTYGGHFNTWGLGTGEWVDFRVVPANPQSAKQIADEAHSFQALVSANHPTMDCKGCKWSYGDLTPMDSVEIWNAKWDEQDEQSLVMWDKLLREGKRITAIGSSDTHQPPYEPSDYPTNLVVGSPTVFVAREGKLSQESLFRSLKKGKVYVAEDPGKRVSLVAAKTARPGETVTFDQEGKVNYHVRLSGFSSDSTVKVIWKLKNGTTGRKTMPIRVSAVEFDGSVAGASPGYLRLEVRNPDGSMAAFTNPIWILGGEQ